MKKSSKNLLVSDRIMQLGKELIQQNQTIEPDVINQQQYPYVLPRTFPSDKIPSKVAIYRKIKQYASVDLNQLLKGVDWTEGVNEMKLSNFVFLPQYVIQYGCSSDNIAKNKVKARAYYDLTKRYQQLQIDQFKPQINQFSGTIIINNTKTRYTNIPRAKTCLNFQNPTLYCHQIQQAIKRRKKVRDIIKYEFYVDNMDLEDAPMPNPGLLKKIKFYALGCKGYQDVPVFISDFGEVVQQYRRVMNQLLFRNEVRLQQLPIYIPTKYVRKKPQYNHIRKKLKVRKGDKILTLVAKSGKQKVQQIKYKSIFLNNTISQILLFMRQKLQSRPRIPLLQNPTSSIIQTYFLEQQQQVNKFLSSINQYIIDPLSSQIRRRLINQPDGWFRLYEQNRGSYYDSKLRRMLLLAENVIRDWAVEIIQQGLQKFLRQLSQWDSEVQIQSMSDCFVKSKDGVFSRVYTYVIRIPVIMEKGKPRLVYQSAKVKKMFKNLIKNSLQKLSKIPSPEPIVLKQLLGGYKNQQGIKIQLPIHKVSSNADIDKNQSKGPSLSKPQIVRYPQILTLYRSLLEKIDNILRPLQQYQSMISKVAQKINLQALYEKVYKNIYSLSQILQRLKQLNTIQQLIYKQLHGFGACIGFFSISYEFVKLQMLEYVHSQSEIFRRKLLYQNRRLNLIYSQYVKDIQRKLQKVPRNIWQMVEKRKLMKNLKQTLQDSTYKQLYQIRQICFENSCRIEPQQLLKQIKTDKTITLLYKSQPQIDKQFQQMKKQQIQNIANTKKDIKQSLQLMIITKAGMRNQKNMEHYREYATKVRYVIKNLEELKLQAIQIGEVELLLQINNNIADLVQELTNFQKEFQPYDLLWISVEKWKNAQIVWLNQPIGSFQLKQPQVFLKELITNLKKSSFILESNGQNQLKQLSDKIKAQIQQFQPKLQLLRLLKKKGLTRKHLQQIGIEINTDIQKITFSDALKYGLFQKIEQIQTISSDAWNQFSLEQTLDRLFKQIYQLKFKVSSYKDKKKNDIYIIVNYKQLTDKIDSILVNIESVQFNPMVKMFEGHIKQIYQKGQYISNSLNICQQFQKLLVQLHPIFDSTDIAKQIPSQNKRFSKVLRGWLELLNYIKSIQSVHDACSSQNIYQKVKSILVMIEGVKKQLISYLQLKRKGFSRFYLLSNSQMFELFSATSDINSVNSLIPKLFDSVKFLKTSQSQGNIIGLGSDSNCFLQFKRKIIYKGINIQNWLTAMQKQIRFSIGQNIKWYFLQNTEALNWVNIVQTQNILPQIVYILYQIFSTNQLQKQLKSLQSFKTNQQKILSELIKKKRSQEAFKTDTIICSLIILITSKLNIAQSFIRNNIQSIQDFDWKKNIKTRFVREGDDNLHATVIQSLNYRCLYGCQFLGLYSRLVITGLTEKMQVIYYLAQKYSLGAAAIGPAGTGKTQTTKDIAKLVGKSCLIYNCSQNFHQSTLLRLLKALAITGLWMCFDQFNRLNYKILNVITEQFSYLLRFRNYGHRVQFSFLDETIWLNPNFQLCVTYNPSYHGRQIISKKLNQLFRTVAVVTPDEYVICQALLYSYGYSKGEKLAKNIINIFKLCKDIWFKQETYDFGLRALRSTLDLSYKLFANGVQNQENSIIQSLKIQNCPKMKQIDSQIFLDLLTKQFQSSIIPQFQKNQKYSVKLSIFKQILDTREGILLCGQPLSGKQTVIQQFKSNFSQWHISTIFHDVLCIDQIFGQLDSTTKLWKDGFFTALVRNNVNQGEKRQKLMIVMNGSVYSQWIENLNSFLDSTRKLSLASGQTLSIPNTLKIVVSCTDLQKASPATITRFGIINYQPLKFKQIIKRYPKFPEKNLLFYQQLHEAIKHDFLAPIEPRFILNWALSFLYQEQINYNNFVYSLAQIYQGLLSQSGKQKFDKLARKYMTFAFSAFDFMIKLNGQPASVTNQFKKFKNFQETNQQFSQKKLTHFEEIFVPTLRSFKLNHIINSFLSNNKLLKHKKIFMLIGEQNIGKSKISENCLNKLPKDKNKQFSLFFTRKTTSNTLFQQMNHGLTRKNANKLGGEPGIGINIWIEDINMPIQNQFDITKTAQMLRLICSQNQWYNFKLLLRQGIQDISILSDAKTIHFSYKYPLNFHPRLYRHIQPIFCGPIRRNEIEIIFSQIFQKCLSHSSSSLISQNLFNSALISKFVQLTKKAINFYQNLKDQQVYSKNILSFSLNDLYRSMKGFLAWKLPQNLIEASQLMKFQLSSNIISKISSKKGKKQISQLLHQQFSLGKQKKFSQKSVESSPITLFHNLEGTNISGVKCEKIQNIADFTSRFQCICDQYKTMSHSTQTIIVFPDLIQYIIKIYRALYLDYSHVAIVGLSKCGKNTIVKLASYLISSQVYTVKESNQSQLKDWQECIKNTCKSCYKSKNIGLFLIKNKLLEFDWFGEDLNKLLHTMYLPHIYSQADIQQLIYMMQSQLVRKNLPTTKQSMLKQYLEYLTKKLHIVLLLNPTFSTFAPALTQYPSITKLCTFFHLDKWPKQALYLIAKLEMPDVTYPLAILPQIHHYSQKICQNSTLAILGEIWEGMYFQFVNLFQTVFYRNEQLLHARKLKYQQSLKVIQQTQDQLQKTKNKIKKLQPTIIMIQNQTAKTVRNLQIQRKNAYQTNQNLTVKNIQFQKIIEESKIIKNELEQKVHIVNLQIQKAWQNVSLIKPNHISEIKALANPSEFIKTVLSALVILTYDGVLAKQIKDVNGHITVQDSYFETAKKFILSKDAKTICKTLIEFKRQNVNKQMFERLQDKCLSYKRWSEKEAKSANKAIYFFFLWVEAVANQYRIYQQTKPLREQLQKISTILSQKEIQVITIKKQLEYFQQRIYEYETQHKQKKQALQQLRIQIRKFEIMLTRGHELINQMSDQKDKWGKYIQQINEKIKNNFGDSIVMAATVVYMSPHIYQIRRKIKHYISSQCKKYNIPCQLSNTDIQNSHYLSLTWHLSREQEQTFQTLQINQNQLLIDNIKIAENSSQVALLIDPEEQGVKLLKKLNWMSLQAPVDKISQYSTNLVRAIQSAIVYGRIVFIEVDASMYNKKLSFVINPRIVTVNNQKQLMHNDKSLPIHPNYRLYLYTTCYSPKQYSMELLTNIQIINFKMTNEQLEQRILQITINTELPILKAKIQEIFRINVKDTATLNSIEERLLVMFSSQLSAEEILQSDEIINTVVHSNRLYKQISTRIQESKAQKQKIEQQKKPYLKKSKQICLMYQNIQRLKLVRSLYSYSYQWFLDLYESNLYSFNLTLYQEVSKALRSDEKIVVAILIAEVLYPTLPWKCLFCVQETKIIRTIYTTHQQQNQLQQQAQSPQKATVKLTTLIPPHRSISTSVWTRSVTRIGQVKKYIPALQLHLIQKPEIFAQLLTVSQDKVLEAIPNQYSQLDFFYRILLVSCFRPECVKGFVKEWIRVNMGAGFVETTATLGSLFNNTKPYRPIMTILDDTSIEILIKIRQIYRQSHPKQQQSSPILNMHFPSITTEQCQQFQQAVKSSITQNAWLVVQSINSIQVLTYIKQYFEELIVQPEKQFRLWIVLPGENGSGIVGFGERFSQFCDKIRIGLQRDLYKEISSAFYRFRDVLISQSDLFQRNKKKMLISQLCILHNILIQFSERYSNLSMIQKQNKAISHAQPPTLLSLTQNDLKLLIEQTINYKIQQSSKQILHKQLINSLTYGSQISSHHLQNLLSLNSGIIISAIITDRTTFWQTIWCDDKFPKSEEEYMHEAKNIVNRKFYLERFGIDYGLDCIVRVREYQMICRFYQMTVFHTGAQIGNIMANRLEELSLQIKKMKETSEYERIILSIEQIKKNKKCPKKFLHFCQLQLEQFDRIHSKVSKTLNNLTLSLTQSQNTSLEEHTILSLYRNISPWSQSQRAVSIDQYCNDLQSRLKLINDFICKYQDVGFFLDCAMMNNFKYFLQVVMEMWKIDMAKGAYRVVFIGINDCSQQNVIRILEGFGFLLPQPEQQQQQNKPKYPEQIVHNQYGQRIKLTTTYQQQQTLKPRKLPTISSLNNQKAKQNSILGYILLKNLFLHNTEVQRDGKKISLKLDYIVEQEENNVLVVKSLMNFALGMGASSLSNSAVASKSIYDRSSGGKLGLEEKLSGILLLVQNQGLNNASTLKKSRRQDKFSELIQSQRYKLVQVPCYEFSLIDITQQVEPIAMFHTLVVAEEGDKVQAQIARKNVHFSLRH